MDYKRLDDGGKSLKRNHAHLLQFSQEVFDEIRQSLKYLPMCD